MIGQDVQNQELTDIKVGHWESNSIGKSPFSNNIYNAKHSTHFKQSEFSKYQEAYGDPFLRLQEFESKFMLHQHDTPLHCKIFSETLQGEALSWFNELQSKSINFWSELCCIFLERFQHNYSKLKDVQNLL